MQQNKKSDSITLILKASALMGSSAVVQIASGIVKSKVIALVLGPVGLGAFSLLQSVQNTASAVAGLGMNSSGIRQIAEAESREGITGISRNYTVLKQVTLGMAFLVAGVMVLFREPISHLVGNRGVVAGTTIAWLGIGVWAITVSGAQTAMLNGMRRIGDLARVNSLGALIGMSVTVIAVWFWKNNGIVHAVVGSSLAVLLVSWWLVRKIELPKTQVNGREFADRSKKLVGLGSVFMAQAVMSLGSQLAVRAILAKDLGMEATGHFHAAWNISMFHIGFVLNAMGTDFFPRLTSVADDHAGSRKLVNEQMEVSLLLTGPIILGMLTFAPFVVSVLYSKAFGEAVIILRWQILGDIFKVAAWPLYYVMLAQGRGRVYFISELLWNLLYLLLVVLGIPYLGVYATGVSFLIAYAILYLFNLFVSFRLIEYVPAKINIAYTAALVCLSLIIIVMAWRFGTVGLLAGGFVSAVSACFSFYRISRSLGRIPGFCGK